MSCTARLHSVEDVLSVHRVRTFTRMVSFTFPVFHKVLLRRKPRKNSGSRNFCLLSVTCTVRECRLEQAGTFLGCSPCTRDLSVPFNPMFYISLNNKSKESTVTVDYRLSATDHENLSSRTAPPLPSSPYSTPLTSAA